MKSETTNLVVCMLMALVAGVAIGYYLPHSPTAAQVEAVAGQLDKLVKERRLLMEEIARLRGVK